MRPPGSAEALERRRRQAVALVQEGHHFAQAARAVGVHRSSVKRWWQAFQKRGDEGLLAKPSPGRTPHLSAYQKRLLVKQLLKGPRAHGFSTDLWTCPRIAQVIEQRYGVHYHVDHIPRLLVSLGWSCQKPEKRAIERDEKGIARWLAKDWPRIKKRHS